MTENLFERTTVFVFHLTANQSAAENANKEGAVFVLRMDRQYELPEKWEIESAKIVAGAEDWDLIPNEPTAFLSRKVTVRIRAKKDAANLNVLVRVKAKTWYLHTLPYAGAPKKKPAPPGLTNASSQEIIDDLTETIAIHREAMGKKLMTEEEAIAPFFDEPDVMSEGLVRGFVREDLSASIEMKIDEPAEAVDAKFQTLLKALTP